MKFDSRRSILIVSSVLPFPRNSGQQQRVYYTLAALRKKFHITFLTAASEADKVEIKNALLEMCDDAIVLPSLYTRSFFDRVFIKIAGLLSSLVTGLKFSNYLYGEVEFSASRLDKVLAEKQYDALLFEYWHAHKASRHLRNPGVISVLDMHDILWKSFARQLEFKQMPGWLKRWRIHKYRSREEAAWNDFDVLIAINQDEYEYTRQRLMNRVKLMLAPMGTDISAWSFCWAPEQTPRRVAYYGGLRNVANQNDAMICFREIMPAIWKVYPETEFWIVGSNPPQFIKDLEHKNRVHVTGYLEKPQEVLKTMSLLLCPWSGIFGFRSRVVEVMALGVPIVASMDAVHGMGLKIGNGILVGEKLSDLVQLSLGLLGNPAELERQSSLARKQIETSYSYESTYGKFADEFYDLVSARMS
ncbi:MAG: glycosyltransferase [Anaerolineales bacterium]|nr:glycosyltransferase [Anaerolineales bacterium]